MLQIYLRLYDSPLPDSNGSLECNQGTGLYCHYWVVLVFGKIFSLVSFASLQSTIRTQVTMLIAIKMINHDK